MCGGLKSTLASLVPSLRAYALCLTSDRSAADELVHSALIEIWTRHHGRRGYALKLAAFSVLRGQFLRRGVAGPILPIPGKRQPPAAGHDFQTRFLRLPRTAREALSLVGAWGFTPAQAAEICGCNQDTIRRRIAVAYRDLTSRRPHAFPYEFVPVDGGAAGLGCLLRSPGSNPGLDMSAAPGRQPVSMEPRDRRGPEGGCDARPFTEHA